MFVLEKRFRDVQYNRAANIFASKVRTIPFPCINESASSEE